MQTILAAFLLLILIIWIEEFVYPRLYAWRLIKQNRKRDAMLAGKLLRDAQFRKEQRRRRL